LAVPSGTGIIGWVYFYSLAGWIFIPNDDGSAGVQLDKHNYDRELGLVRATLGRIYNEKRYLGIYPQSVDLPGLEAAIENSKKQLSFLPVALSRLGQVDDKLIMRSPTPERTTK
jgi:hypothetical protein